MTKTLLALSGALLLAVPSVLHAQGAHSFGSGGGGGAHSAAFAGGRPSAAFRGGYRGYGGGYGGHHYGRYYYLGGVPYFYPFYGDYGYGFGYPYYAYNGYWDGYYGGPGAPNGYGADAAYEGRVADQGAPNEQEGASLPLAVQRQLSKRGYYKGTVDGNFGPASRSALSRFQRDNHLKETGRIDEDTLDALGFADHR